MSWKEEIVTSASNIKMCTPYLSALKKLGDKLSALRLYKAGVDWALEHNFPAADFLRNNYTRFELEHTGIYMDRVFHGEVINDHIFQVFHNCTGNIKVELNRQKIIIPTLYLANGTNLSVEVDKEIDISVFLFDTSVIQVQGKWKLRTVVPDPLASDPSFKPNLKLKDL